MFQNHDTCWTCPAIVKKCTVVTICWLLTVMAGGDTSCCIARTTAHLCHWKAGDESSRMESLASSNSFAISKGVSLS